MEVFHQEAIEEEDYLHTGGMEFIGIKNKQGLDFWSGLRMNKKIEVLPFN